MEESHLANRTESNGIREELRNLGLRATRPRIAVLGLLRSAQRPLSHAEVAQTLTCDEWDRATIFRNLIRLKEAGLARLSSHAGGVARYEATVPGESSHNHAHFSCTDCGRVQCLPESPMAPLPLEADWRTAVNEAEVQIVGTCPTCRNLVKTSHP